jgi:hypothetical protein
MRLNGHPRNPKLGRIDQVVDGTDRQKLRANFIEIGPGSEIV